MQLQFSTSKDLASRIIRIATWSDYSHVDIVMPDGKLLGARIDGVFIRPRDYTTFTKTLLVEVAATTDVVVKAAMAEIGKPYDMTAILNFGFHRNWHDPSKWFCSELVAWVFQQAEVPLVNPKFDSSRVTPRDLLLSPVVKY